MALPRPYWTGQLRLSLVTIPVKLYSATSSDKQIALHQIHEPSGKRIRYQKVAPGIGPVDTDEIIKGFEYEKGKYVLLEPEEIDELKLESKQTIELVRFVEQSEIDPRYFEKPYYVLPDGENAEEGYAVIQKALSEAKKVGLGQVVMRGKSSLVGIKPCGKGLLLEMLRQADEVRSADQFFDEIPDVKVDKEALELGEELIKRKTGPFEPEKFKDDYTDAMWELIHAKIEKREPEFIAETPASGKVINIMDALKKSVSDQDNKKSSTKSRSTKSKSTKSTAKNDNKSKSPRKKSA
ncbi:putative DNA repair protein YkoV [Methyloligella halotolerans]|uniref:Non-homologous end joining protein Ku n=1 Tax=Methyloligella halotolerans TaxID=1177755 RepID=A0A1E2S0C4_9HYPH|nr:Ku protein [Methyloligella halotolerans]ODA67924.1 putative DNA repair protein YkoV [Methyloligella halotolerans]